MKAQSELAGDRKRRAEMTRPRFGGVTVRMISGMDPEAMNHGFASDIEDYIVRASALQMLKEELQTTSDVPGVNHRPAGR